MIEEQKLNHISLDGKGILKVGLFMSLLIRDNKTET